MSIGISLPEEINISEHLENGVIDDYLLGDGKEIAFSPTRSRRLTDNEERFRQEYRNLSKNIEKTVIESMHSSSKKDTDSYKHKLAILQFHLQNLSANYPFILLYPKVVKKVKNLESEVETALCNLQAHGQMSEIEEKFREYEDILCLLIEKVSHVQSHDKALNLHKQFDSYFKKLAHIGELIHTSKLQGENKTTFLQRLADLQEGGSNLHFKLCLLFFFIIIHSYYPSINFSQK